MGVIIVDYATGKRMFVNSAFAKIVGASHSEGLIDADALQSWPDADSHRRVLKDIQSNEFLPFFEAWRLRLDGSRWCALMSTQPAIFAGREVRIVWHMDITERKNTELTLEKNSARFQDFAESSSDWLWETDGDYLVTYVAERFKEITGIDPSSYIGKSRKEFSKENMHEPKWARHLEDLENHLPFRGFTNDVVTPDGSVLTVSSSAKPVFNDKGEFLGYRGTSSDITRQKRIEESRDTALREAEQANQAKSEFLATMSHEFRTPLNAIIGFSELMCAQYFGPLGSGKYKGYAEDIHQSGEHMLALINDVLDMAAIEAGKRIFNIEQCSIEELIRDSVRNVELMASEADIALVSDVPDGLPPLNADARSIRQIMLNLLSNALKFTNENGQVSISASATNKQIQIRVEDTGIGIPEDRLADIAKPFSQLHADPHITQDGTGLGLSIVQSLVDTHEGEMKIESEPGVGTTVTLAFPR
jgi:PAS domain S-box-containing protein